MNKVTLIKAVTELLVSVGVGAITGNAIKTVSPSNANKFTKFCVGLGGFVLSSIMIDKASEYTRDTVQQAADLVHTIVEKNTNNNEELDG